MGLHGAFFITLFCLLIVAAIFNPFWGILAYMGHYYLWPEAQWWGEILAAGGVRVSLTIAAVTALSMFVHWGSLRKKIIGPVFHSQEWLLWGFVLIVGLSDFWGLPHDPIYAPSIHPFEKMYKVGIFTFMITHVVTTRREIDRFLWFIFVVGGLYMGVLAYTLPASHFVNGRLEGIGGPDFMDSNFAAVHFVVMGIVGAILILKSSNWAARIFCLGSGAMIANALILTRSRGAFLGVIGASCAAIVLADRTIRKHLIWVLPLVAIGCYSLTDVKFWDRIVTIFASPEQLDESAESRLEFWRASIEIFSDHPLGVGAGRFFGVIGDYRPQYAGRDAHSLYFRCLAELGVFGTVALVVLIGNAFRVLRRCQRIARDQLHCTKFVSIAIGFQLILVVFASCGLTMTLTYSEEFFLFLLLPVCLQRAIDHAVVTEGSALTQQDHAMPIPGAAQPFERYGFQLSAGSPEIVR